MRPTLSRTAFAAEMVYSPIYRRLLFGNAPLDARFAEDLVTTALRGLTAVVDARP